MATLQSLKKAYGALKDSTKVGLAHVNSDYRDLDVAIVKATNHVECPPKDRHLRKILIATSAIRPRADVGYCIHALSRRLAKTRNWTVALKTLIVIHRALRDGDPTFKEEILNFSLRGHILQLSNFKDDSSPIAWDCSAWVRTYALFLEERLECFRILKYDVETQRLPKAGDGNEKGYSRTRELGSDELLEQLPALQQLLFRLIGCRPEGAAFGNFVIQYALALVLKESFKIYCAINDGIINLIDKFFEMPKHEAITALEIYRRASQQAASLSDFYEVCKGLELARNFQFPVLREPPHSFLATMEEYIREAPRIVSVPRDQLEFPERLQLTYKTEEDAATLEVTPVSNHDHVPGPDFVVATTPETPQNNDGIVDFLGLDVSAPDASSIDERNALALAIVPSDAATSSGSGAPKADFDPSGWELALVTTPSTDLSSANERQLAGGLDTLTLNSLYDEGAYRATQKPAYGVPAPNPFEHADTFYPSMGTTPPPTYQMPPPASHPGMNPFAPSSLQQLPPTFQSTPSHQQHNPDEQLFLMAAPSNPFADEAFGPFPGSHFSHTQTSNPFGSTALL